ncbi:hypothetical protein [Vitreimonas sp.]|uniref:DUF1285 family C-terminal domain-containing protein n=1 Tax=Vitreimonas sp. TaxID=3069702 RepID=UPI0039C98F4F
MQAEPGHPLRVEVRGEGEPCRLCWCADGWKRACSARAPSYELVDWAETRDGKLGVWSGGVWFELGVG